ncbi:RNA polymerase sigma factor [Fibrella aquatica]|uniref:RNA polymerase sigma factor n=1 Tax=Fibrella aquatica TaxID=3242487 RepID=UPI003520D738
MARQRTSPKIDEVKLWDEFRSGNQPAFATLYQEYVNVLFHYCSHFSQDRALIKDCIHDLFVELWRHRQNIGPTTSVRFYLMASIKRKLVRHITAEQKFCNPDDLRPGEGFTDSDRSYEMTLIQTEEDTHLNSCLTRALDRLPRRQREAVYLKFYQNMGNEEISKLMDINIQSVYNLIFGALGNLKKHVSIERFAM